MTLRELIRAHPEAFYPQTWYEDEAFMDREAMVYARDVQVVDGSPDDRVMAPRYSAADLAWLWLEAIRPPHAGCFVSPGGIWSRYLWTSDTDSQGQRVYLGQNGRGLEIHRHLHLTERWGVPV